MNPRVTESIFEKSDRTPWIAMLRIGLAATGVYQVRLHERVCNSFQKKYFHLL